MSDKIYIHEGVFKSFDEAGRESIGFSSTRWLDSQQQFLDITRNANWNSQYPIDQSLAMILAILGKTRNSTFKILDIGGGLGATYYWLKQVLDSHSKIDLYQVVELPAVVEAIKNNPELINGNDDNEVLYFSENIPELRFDVVNYGSSLHYFENWKDLLMENILSGASSFSFSRTPVSDNVSYVTLQNYYESKIPVWVFGLDEISQFFSEQGYKLIYKGASCSPVLGKLDPIPVRNIPDENKIKYFSDLVFMRD